MLLASHGRIQRQTHVVVPISAKEPAMMSRVRASVVLPDDGPSQTFALWAFPNAQSQRNWWEYKASTELSFDLDIALNAVGMQHPKSGAVNMMNVVAFSANFDEFLLEGSWDTSWVNETIETDLEFLHNRYGKDYAFVLTRLTTSGTYELEWIWYGTTPFFHNAQPSHHTTGDLVVMGLNQTRILWTNPNGGDSRGPPRQRSLRNPDRIKKLKFGPAKKVWYIVAAQIVSERRRNDDISAEACEQTAEADETYGGCCLC